MSRRPCRMLAGGRSRGRQSGRTRAIFPLSLALACAERSVLVALTLSGVASVICEGSADDIQLLAGRAVDAVEV